ncbi:MAG: DUF3068 domain-containing protein [Nocardioides sp.]|uniref:DUF3068 domain-containing protein n=1 Tax=Nocardioides sp. TaxID=35761 RepID=UPI003F05AC6A
MLRKIVSWVLIGLGAFLLVIAILAKTWAPGVLQKTPTNIDQITRLAGSGEKINPESGEVEPITVRVTNLTQTDADRSDDNNVVWASTVCVVKDEPGTPDCVDGEDPRLVSATVDVFQTDRVTALATGGDREGIQNKFPFNTEKRTYPYWDGILGEALDAEFQGTEDFDGVESYHFQVSAENVAAEVSSGIDGFYTTKKDIWVEPVTGAIINQEQYEHRELEDGTVAIDLTVAMTDEQVEKNIEDAKTNVSGLNLLLNTVPLVGFIGGALLLVIGLLLSRRKAEQA